MDNKQGQHRDTRYLEKHQDLWRVVVGYRAGGKVVKLRRSLGTGSLREAQHRRWAIVAALKASITTAPTDDVDAWRAALAAGDGGPDDPTPHLLSDHLDAIRGDPIATEQGEGGPVYLYDPERERRATELATQVYQTPLEHHLDAFMASRGQLKADTLRRYTGPMKALGAWLKREGLPATIETVDRRVAIRYVDQLSPGRPDPKRLSLYWQWMVKREHAQTDPWRDLQVVPRARVEPERAFTEAEAKRLLSGPCEPSLNLLMQVAALTGARLDAIFHMRIDWSAGTIIFPPQKKELGPRTIPLHSHLGGSLADFKGWPWPSSNGAGKAFMAHRRKVLGSDPAGRRRAIVNMHSWRRWFISQAERAGIDERVISDVVGHKRKSMTGRYSAGASMEQMRVCVEAVKLPNLSLGSHG